ncbi:collagen triple helix repeat-containing protein 1-like [Montipora capricornis]|uniref:collagen triple helix repeat-containing protein 1-like n=1 Tax=Montipora capricornis TaxID=246305 RepID=UPI0035F102D1
MNLLITLALQSILILAVCGQLFRTWTNRDCQRMIRECGQVTRGSEGAPGPKGPSGNQGNMGPVGAKGNRGEMGPPGRLAPGQISPVQAPAGDPGERGRTGTPGDPGDPGFPGQKGRKGYQGFPGNMGRKGDEGYSGDIGPRGNVGSPGTLGSWTRFSWEINVSIDRGLLKECIFTKQDLNSVLHVVYEGNLQIGLCSDCCKRWFFSFNDAECPNPGSIDGVMSGGLSPDYPFYSYGRIEGFCEKRFPTGPVRVGLRMENCPTYNSSSTPYNLQLHNRYGKILIQEVSPSQQNTQKTLT